jgi:hypothetical protein
MHSRNNIILFPTRLDTAMVPTKPVVRGERSRNLTPQESCEVFNLFHSEPFAAVAQLQHRYGVSRRAVEVAIRVCDQRKTGIAVSNERRAA